MGGRYNLERKFDLEVAKGNVTGQRGFDQFGANPIVSAGTPEDVWDGGGTYAFPASTLASGTVTAASVLENTFATGTAQCTSVIATDTVTINGLKYTAVAGAKEDNTEFSIDTGDTECALDLSASINADVRVGTLGTVTASPTADTVTITTSVAGVAGDAVTMTETGSTITLSGAVLDGGVDADTCTINGLVYTAVSGTKADATEFSTDTSDDATATDLAASITADVRVGTIGKCSATATTDTVTAVTNVIGTPGNATTLVSSDGATLAVSGATFSGGTFAAITKLSQTTNQAALVGANIEVKGLDLNWDEVTQVLALNGSDTTTAVTLVTPLARVSSLKVLANVVCDQPIRAHNTDEDVDYAVIAIGNNSSRMAIYTVPDGYTGYITSYYGGSVEAGSAQPTSVEFTLMTADRDNGYAFMLRHASSMPKLGAGFDHEFTYPLEITQRTDIKIRASAVAEAGNIRAGFNMLLVRNDLIDLAE